MERDDRAEFQRQVRGLMSGFVKDYKWFGLAIGTTTVLAHFWRIRYLPTLGIADVGLMALAILMFSAIALFAIAIICVLPGFVLIGWSTQRVIPRPQAPVARRTSNAGRKNKQDKEDESKPRRKRKGMGYTLQLVYSGFAVALCIYAAALSLPTWAKWWVCLAILAISTTIVTISSIALDLRGPRFRALSTKSKRALSTFLTSALYGVSIPLTLALYYLTQIGDDNLELSPNLIVILIVPLAHWTIYATQRMPMRLKTAIPGIALIYFMCAAGLPFRLLDQSLRTFSLGLMEDQTVLVTRRGCDIVKAAHIAASCNPITESSAQLFALSPVTIQTRIGSHMLIADQGWTPGNKARRAPIPSSDIASWFDRINEKELDPR